MKMYDIHPISVKYIRGGHPWVTRDQFSEKFNPKERFIIASAHKKPLALLIHDPTHKNVRARVWSRKGNFEKQIQSFEKDFVKRLEAAFEKRKTKTWDREHYYICFGELDDIPGLKILKLKDQFLIQYYSSFWVTYQNKIMNSIEQLFRTSRSNIWMQLRTGKKKPASCLDSSVTAKDIIVNEAEFSAQITLGRFYDHGLYTDMAQIRQKLTDKIADAKRFLNLYSYTGAYSLQALSLKVPEVFSCDLSEVYLTWLQENIQLNNFEGIHTSYCNPVEKQLDSFKQEKKQFDFIVCDPPTSSSDGKKRSNALSNYASLLPQIYDVLERGGLMVIFLNTHNVTFAKFQKKVTDIIKQKKLRLKQVGSLKMEGDCPVSKIFPEGNYLKGIILEKL